jgi:prepilin-type N-terminal cleavage/methylation domain-containing protein/prepilin-type processing-associated H-X9-DG protein
MAKSSPPRVERGFTLIEMIVVLGVIAIMMSFVYPGYLAMSERAKATKDMSNLHQIALATQMYMNDNSGAFPGSTTVTWMSQFETNQKYLSAWRVLQSPFDRRPSSEAGTGNPVSKISYGINSAAYDQTGAAISADKIRKPTSFIVFAPAQDNTALPAPSGTVKFQGTALNGSAQGVTLSGNNNAVTSNPGGVPLGGTHNSRRKINALFADWHVEMMDWSGTGPAFTNTTSTASDPDGDFRWSP